MLFALENLLASNPGIAVTVFTDDAGAFAGRTGPDVRLETVPGPRFSYLDKIHGFINAPYDMNVYMDTDTVVVADISPLFTLLDRFDFAAAMGVGAHGRRNNVAGDDPLPEAFAEFNSGVVCFRRSPETHAVFLRWHELYTAAPGQVHDQPSLRQALYESKLSLYVLPPEFNFLGGFAVLSGPVRVFHSPNLCANPGGFVAFSQMVNTCVDVRLLVPPDRLFTIRR
jgi:hypothetical protein